MNILYALHGFFPDGIFGTERFTFNLATEFQRQGHSVQVVAYSLSADDTYRPYQSLLIKEYVYENLPVITYMHQEPPEDINISLSKDKAVYSWAMKLLARKDFDLLHITHPMRTSSLAMAAAKRKIPLVVTLTDFFLLCHQYFLMTSRNEICFGPQGGRKCLISCSLPPGGKYYLRHRWFQSQELLRQAAQIIVPSKFVAGVFQREFPGLTAKVVPTAVNPAFISKNEKLYFSDSPVTFGYMGGLFAHKGVHLLIETFKKLAGSSCRLKIYGDSNDHLYKEKLKVLAGDDERIEFCGAYSLEKDVAYILKNVDILCVPSLCHEAYGLVIQEALVAGVPVIGSQRGAIPESIKDGMNGYTFNLDREEELYDIMTKVIQNPLLINDLKKTITPPPTVKDVAGEYEQIYRRVVDNNKSQLLLKPAKSLDSSFSRAYYAKAVCLVKLYYKIRDKLLPSNTKRRLWVKIGATTIFSPIMVIKNLNMTNLRKFFYYYRTDPPGVLGGKISKKLLDK